MSKGLYVHVPFCVRKCLYCDFYSQTDFSLGAEYVDSVLKELEKYKGESFDTVFVGGGTPTSLGGELVRLCEALPKAEEFTVEANPGTVDFELLKALKAAGANRLSIGVQSFNDSELKALGRIHTAAQAEDAFLAARRAGFRNISVDLMLSTPGQSLASVKHSLERVRELSPDHVSAYSLIIEEGTPFYDMELDLPNEDEEREIYWYVCEFLNKIGLKQYEISNFALPERESRHNLKYWSGGEYIGIGAAAASYNGGFRYRNGADLKKYLHGEGMGLDREKITPKERLGEKFWLGLRKTAGVEYFGEFPEAVEKLVKEGLLEHSGKTLRLTKRGTDLANLVFMEFV